MVTSHQELRLTPGARSVLDAAAAMFYERGITAVSVEAIAEKAGVTKKTAYDRFKSKGALVCAYLSERDQRYRDWVEAWITDHPKTPALLAVLDALDAWMDSYGPYGCAFVHAHAELLSEPGHPAHAVITEQKQWLHDRFRTLAVEADASQPEALATELLALHEGASVLRSTTDLRHAVRIARRAAETLVDAANKVA